MISAAAHQQIFGLSGQRSEHEERVTHGHHAREAEKIDGIEVSFHGADHCLQSSVLRNVSAHIIVELSETGL